MSTTVSATAIDKTELKASLLRKYSEEENRFFASSALTGNHPQFVAEQLVRASAKIGIISVLAGHRDPMVLVRYLDDLRAMVPSVISRDISPECAVINAL